MMGSVGKNKPREMETASRDVASADGRTEMAEEKSNKN